MILSKWLAQNPEHAAIVERKRNGLAVPTSPRVMSGKTLTASVGNSPHLVLRWLPTLRDKIVFRNETVAQALR